jgi:hypothetical protein
MGWSPSPATLADGTRHVLVGVTPYRPASRLPKGRNDPAFHTKPDLAWQLIEAARAAHIPFHLVVADRVYGESAQLESRLFAAQIPDVMGLRPSHGTWQFVEDAAHPPACTPAEAAARLPREAWERTVRDATHGKELVRYIAELELGTTYGPTRGVRLVAATLDPATLKPESTWSLATSLTLEEASPEVVDEWDRLRDWIEHFSKPVKHELGWADYQMRPERAIVRHWQLVLLAYTFTLLVGALPPAAEPEGISPADQRDHPNDHVGKKTGHDGQGTGRVAGGAAPGPGVALPVGSAADLLAALVEQRPTARAGRAPRPSRPRAPAGGAPA